MTFLDGSFFEGDFLNNQIHGKGNNISIQENITGVVIEPIKASGNTTKCTELGKLNGVTGEDMRGNMLRIKKRNLEPSIGQMGESTLVVENKGNSMEEDIILC